MNEQQLKKLREVFPDFNSEEELLNSYIKNANLYKKSNKLLLDLASDERINLKNIYTLENYLKSRFSVKDAQIKIERNTEFNIKNEWENIISYINVKYPLTKAILINNSAEINEKNILIKLAVKGEDFLVASGFDKIIEKSILDFYNKEYKIKITENIDKELVKKYEENTKRIERMAIELAEQEITWEEEKPKQTKQENLLL